MTCLCWDLVDHVWNAAVILGMRCPCIIQRGVIFFSEQESNGMCRQRKCQNQWDYSDIQLGFKKSRADFSSSVFRDIPFPSTNTININVNSMCRDRVMPTN